MQRVEKINDHWIWRGGTDSFGQPSTYEDNRRLSAKRVSWKLFRGPIKKSKIRKLVARTCDHSKCVNPSHLEITSNSRLDRYDSIQDRFWKRVKRGPMCWEWTGHCGQYGYGRLSVNGEVIPAHRYSWEIHNGNIPKDRDGKTLFVCHRCDNRKCVRPDHLFIGTSLDNTKDRDAKGRTRRKFSETDRSKIMKYASLGLSFKEISKLMEAHETSISRFLKGKTWRHVK